MPETDDAELTQKDAAAFLEMSVRTLQRLRGRKKGPPYRQVTERKIRYPKASLVAYRQSCLVEPAA